MKNIFKKALAGILSGVMAVSALSFTAAATSVTTLTVNVTCDDSEGLSGLDPADFMIAVGGDYDAFTIDEEEFDETAEGVYTIVSEEDDISATATVSVTVKKNGYSVETQSKTLTANTAEFDIDVTTLYSGYQIYAEIAGGTRPLTDVTNASGGNDFAVWVGGGKATLSTGTIVDGKTIQLNLYAIEDNEYYNITTAKTTVWGLTTAQPGTGTSAPALSSGKYTSDSAAGKISKGKVTVPKDLPKDGVIYAVAFANVAKNSSGTFTGDYVGYATINVRQAASAVVVYETKAEATASSLSDNVIKTINVPIGGITVNSTTKVETQNKDLWVSIYPVGGVKNGKTVKPATGTDYNTYTVTVATKATGNLAVGNPVTGTVGSSVSFTATQLAQGVQLIGLSMTGNKATKAAITITNNQSGKKASFSAVVGNPVIGIDNTVADATATPAVVAGKAPGNVLTLTKDIKFTVGTAGTETVSKDTINGAVKLGDKSIDTTDKAVISVISKPSSGISGVTYTTLTTNGKLKAVKVSGVTASMKSGAVEVKATNKATAGDYYVVIAYNTADLEKVGDTTYLSNVLYVPVTVAPAATTETTIATTFDITATNVTDSNYVTGSLKLYKGTTATDATPINLVTTTTVTPGSNKITVTANLVAETNYYVVVDTNTVGMWASTAGATFKTSAASAATPPVLTVGTVTLVGKEVGASVTLSSVVLSLTSSKATIEISAGTTTYNVKVGTRIDSETVSVKLVLSDTTEVSGSGVDTYVTGTASGSFTGNATRTASDTLTITYGGETYTITINGDQSTDGTATALSFA